MNEKIDHFKNDDVERSTDLSRSWLQRLKEESWEAELLVAAISIFGSYQMFNLINWWSNKFIDLLYPSQYLIGYGIVYAGLLGLSILFSMFVIHFFLRAYWIGLVGLNSVFPDYSIKDSAYSKIYTKNILSILPKLKDSIQKVDELCSVIFSVAFTLLLMYLYVGIFFSFYLLIFNLLSDYVNTYILLTPAILIAVSMIIQLIVSTISNLKSNRDKEGLQIWNFKIVRFVYIIYFGPLYKSILQVVMIFGSNYKKKKSLVYLIFLFFSSGILVSTYQMTKTNIPYLINRESYFDVTKSYSSYYKSENTYNNFLLNPEIESDKIKDHVLKLFIPIFSYEKKLSQDRCGSISKDAKKSRLEQRRDRRAQMLNCYHKYNFVYVNGEKSKVDYLRYDHPITNQSGIICYVELDNLKTGINRLKVKKEYGDKGNSEWVIPFYYISKD